MRQLIWVENNCLNCAKVNDKSKCSCGAGVVVWKNCKEFKMSEAVLERLRERSKARNNMNFI